MGPSSPPPKREQSQRAFDNLKAALSDATVLALPRDEGEFTLGCDASDLAIGAVLSQVQDGEERPICYASQLYNKHERNYNVTRKELLAVVTFVRNFRQYLLGRTTLRYSGSSGHRSQSASKPVCWKSSKNSITPSSTAQVASVATPTLSRDGNRTAIIQNK